jgi:hypothetical protein
MFKLNTNSTQYSSKLTFLVLPLFFILIFSISHLFKEKFDVPPLVIDREKHAININESIFYFNAGLKRFLSSVVWIKTLIDSDISRSFDRSQGSWIYLRFLLIAKLDPYFLENYQFGGKYLSIVKDDLNGAENLLKIGLKYYKDDYVLNYDLAFLYFSELKNYDLAIPYLKKISTYPEAPVFINALIATVMEKNNISPQIIISFLEDSLDKTSIPHLKNRYQEKIARLKSMNTNSPKMPTP